MSPREISAAANLFRYSKLQLEGASTPELVRLGSDLGAITTKIKVWMEALKDKLRTQVPPTPGQHLLRGVGATCQVTVPKVTPVLRSEVDVSVLRRALGEDFDRLFNVQEVVTPRDDFSEALQGVEDSKVAFVLAAVDLANHKPRISFHEVP